jgi:hypothetical protein
VLINDNLSILHTEYIAIFDTDETNIASTSNTNSYLCKSEPKTLISSALVTSMDLKDSGIWSTSIARSVCDMIVCCVPIFSELVDFVKHMPKYINGKSFSRFMLYTKLSNTRESFPQDWLIWNEIKKSLHTFTN